MIITMSERGVEALRSQLEELLSCQICYGRAVRSTMCPRCSKVYCSHCLGLSLELRPECPSCRQRVGVPTDCSRLIDEVARLADQLIEHRAQQPHCLEHGVHLSYYCEECKVTVCADCGLFGFHRNHSFVRIDVIHKLHYDHLRELLSQLKIKLGEGQKTLLSVGELLKQLQRLKDAQLNEVETYCEKHKQSIQQLMIGQSQDFAGYLAELEETEKLLREQIESPSCSQLQSPLQGKTRELLARKPLQESVVEKTRRIPVNHKSESPTEEKFKFKLSNVMGLRANRESISCPSKRAFGAEWILRLYPKNNQSLQVTVAVELQCTATTLQPLLMRWSVEAVPSSEENGKWRKEYFGHFQTSTVAKCDQFLTLETMGSMLHGEDLHLQLSLRPLIHYQICHLNELTLLKLREEVEEQQRQIERLKVGLKGGEDEEESNRRGKIG